MNALLRPSASFVVALALLVVGAAAGHAADGWVRPSTTSDAESAWDFEGDGIDGNPATYAQDTSNRVGDGAWLELALPAAIRTDRVRITADFGYGAVDAVAVEALEGGVWVQAFSGPVGNATATDVPIDEATVARLRFRFHYTTTGYWFWLYEIAAYQLGDTITPPTVATLAPTSVWSDAAVFHASVDAAGGAPAEVRFQYGTSLAYDQATDWSGSLASGETVAARVPAGLTAGVTWHVRAEARNVGGVVVDGNDVAFVPAPIATATWLSPPTVIAGGWIAADGAFDDEAETSARAFHDLYSAEWSPWLEADLPPSRVSGVRFSAARGLEVDGLQVAVRRDGAWVTVEDGDFTDRAVTGVDLDPTAVDGIRARMHMRRPEVGQFWDLYQLQVRVEPQLASNQPPVVAAGPAASGTVDAPIALDGSASDDGLPAGSALTLAWDVVSGPGAVAFADPANAATTATFAVVGSYVVRLTASDGVLSASATTTVSISDGEVAAPLPAPVVSAWRWNGPAVEVFGSVPDGYAIAAVAAEVTTPTAVATSTLTAGLYRIAFDRGSATSATVDLAFVDGAGRHGPTTTAVLDFTVGGSGGGGDSTQLAPPPPGVTVTITDGLTGDRTGTLAGESVSFTNKPAVTVQVAASASYGSITGLTLLTSDGQSIDLGSAGGPSLTASQSVSFASEGRIELTAEATVANAGQSTSGMTSTPVVLIVDRTLPELTFVLADRYRPTGSTPTDPPTPLRHGLTDDADLVLLNGNGESDNQPLRESRGMNVFDHSGFTLDAEVVDQTGPASTAIVGTVTSESGATVPLGVAIARAATADAPALIEASGFGGLAESVQYDPDYLDIQTFRGRWTVNIDLTDRAGNRLHADQLKLWVDTKPPAAQFGRIPYQDSFAYRGFVNGRSGVGVSPARYVVTTSDVVEAWQDAVGDANRLPCLAGSATDLPHSSYPPRLLGWLLKTPANVPNTGESDPATVVLRDFCGNLSSAQTLHTTLQITSLADPYVPTPPDKPVRHGLSGYGSSGGSPIADQPVARLSPASPMDDTMCWLFGSANYQRKSLLTPSGVRAASSFRAAQNVPSIVGIEAITTRPTYDYTPIIVDALDPGDDGDARMSAPVVISIPPSWKTDPTDVAMRVKDPGIQTARNFGDSSYAFSLALGMTANASSSSVDRLIFAKTPLSGSGDTLQGTVTIARTGPSAATPGFARVDYGSSTYHNITGFRWADLVRLSPDVIATGTRTTIRIDGGFVDPTFAPAQFDPKGDYVHFLKGGTDVTLTARDYDPSADPTTRTGKIAIAGQRFVPGAGAGAQGIELDLIVDAEVPAAAFDVDVKCGAVKAYTDASSAATAGANGSHRMAGALAVFSISIDEPTTAAYDPRPALCGIFRTDTPTVELTQITTLESNVRVFVDDGQDHPRRTEITNAFAAGSPWTRAQLSTQRLGLHRLIMTRDGVEIAQSPFLLFTDDNRTVRSELTTPVAMTSGGDAVAKDRYALFAIPGTSDGEFSDRLRRKRLIPLDVIRDEDSVLVRSMIEHSADEMYDFAATLIEAPIASCHPEVLDKPTSVASEARPPALAGLNTSATPANNAPSGGLPIGDLMKTLYAFPCDLHAAHGLVDVLLQEHPGIHPRVTLAFLDTGFGKGAGQAADLSADITADRIAGIRKLTLPKEHVALSDVEDRFASTGTQYSSAGTVINAKALSGHGTPALHIAAGSGAAGILGPAKHVSLFLVRTIQKFEPETDAAKGMEDDRDFQSLRDSDAFYDLLDKEDDIDVAYCVTIESHFGDTADPAASKRYQDLISRRRTGITPQLQKLSDKGVIVAYPAGNQANPIRSGKQLLFPIDPALAKGTAGIGANDPLLAVTGATTFIANLFSATPNNKKFQETLASHSGTGPSLTATAPGDEGFSRSKDGNYCSFSGTSMSGPFGAGVLAELTFVDRANGRSLSGKASNKRGAARWIMESMEAGCELDRFLVTGLGGRDLKAPNQYYGYGRVNLWRSALIVANGGLPAPSGAGIAARFDLPQADPARSYYGFRLYSTFQNATLWLVSGAGAPSPLTMKAGGTPGGPQIVLDKAVLRDGGTAIGRVPIGAVVDNGRSTYSPGDDRLFTASVTLSADEMRDGGEPRRLQVRRGDAASPIVCEIPLDPIQLRASPQYGPGGAAVAWDGLFIFDVRESMIVDPSALPTVAAGATPKLVVPHPPGPVHFSLQEALDGVTIDDDGTLHGMDAFESATIVVRVTDESGRHEDTRVVFGSPQP